MDKAHVKTTCYISNKVRQLQISLINLAVLIIPASALLFFTHIPPHTIKHVRYTFTTYLISFFVFRKNHSKPETLNLSNCSSMFLRSLGVFFYNVFLVVFQ